MTTEPLVPGSVLTGFSRQTGFPHWNRYAAINHEFIDIHMDDQAGQAAGYATAFGMGNLTFAYLHDALREWFGEQVEISSVTAQFRSAITRNNEISVSGTVTEVTTDGADRVVSVDLLAVDAQGTRLAPGSAVVRIHAETSAAAGAHR